MDQRDQGRARDIDCIQIKADDDGARSYTYRCGQGRVGVQEWVGGYDGRARATTYQSQIRVRVRGGVVQVTGASERYVRRPPFPP